MRLRPLSPVVRRWRSGVEIAGPLIVYTHPAPAWVSCHRIGYCHCSSREGFRDGTWPAIFDHWNDFGEGRRRIRRWRCGARGEVYGSHGGRAAWGGTMTPLLSPPATPIAATENIVARGPGGVHLGVGRADDESAGQRNKIHFKDMQSQITPWSSSSLPILVFSTYFFTKNGMDSFSRSRRNAVDLISSRTS
jgi:hypothetical protein